MHAHVCVCTIISYSVTSLHKYMYISCSLSLSPQAASECLSEPEVSESEHTPLLHQLLQCVLATTNASGDSCPQHSLRLFSVLLRVAASRHLEHLKMEVCVGEMYNN